MPSLSDESKGPKKTDKVEGGPEGLAENLYKKNVELLTKNKTLSLLSKLYEISILALEPKDLALRLCQTVQVDLSFEHVGILIYENKSDSLLPLAFSNSERVKKSLDKIGESFEDMKIQSVSSQNFYKQVILSKVSNRTDDLSEVWGKLIDPTKLQIMVSESHIKTVILYPLKVENKILGAIMLSLNRSYEVLSAFEKESITSFVNLIALALEKAFLYKELENANVQLRELDRQKDELISIVSHQLATPVSSVKWYLEMLHDGDLGKLTAEQTKHVEEVQGVTVNLVDLVGMILDVSRIQLGKMKIDPQPMDLDAFFKEILAVLDPKAKEKDVEFIHVLPAKLPTVLLDKRLTRMTIENLLSNAIKYTPTKGKVTMNLEIKGEKIHFSVKDTGCGIPKKDQGQIFGKLFRASNVRNTADGNGFGLYVAKGAIENQGGRIWFESEEGKGTQFFIELPLKSPKSN